MVKKSDQKVHRRVINTQNAKYEDYDFEGPILKDIGQLDLTYDRETGLGAYMIRMQAGSETTRHVHTIREEYLIIDGDLVESDGLVLGSGDYVIYETGTKHNTIRLN